MSKLSSKIEELERKLTETYVLITDDWKNVGHIRCYDSLLEPIRMLVKNIQNVKDCEKRSTKKTGNDIPVG